MKELLKRFNKVFENRIRLAVMSVLVVHDRLDFTALKDLLAVTDGNLASHMTMLEKNGYLKVRKQFVGKKPLTTYSATPSGKKALKEHLSALEQFLRSHNH